MGKDNWYHDAAYLLHLDYHTTKDDPVGRDADEETTDRLLALSGADTYQIHAKGNPGYTTYPSKIGYNPPNMKGDVVKLWTDIAARRGKPFSCYYNIGRDQTTMKSRPEWNRVRADGTLYDNMLCFIGGVVEGYLWPQIKEIMERYKPAGFWFDGSCFTVNVCYCEACKEKFRGLYDAQLPVSSDEPLWDEFKEMQRQGYRDLIKVITDRIKEIDRDCLVTFNVANSVIMPEQPAYFDYLTADYIIENPTVSFYVRVCAGTGLPFELMTGVWQPLGNFKRMVIKSKTHLEYDAARALSYGGRFNLWDTPTDGGGLLEDRMKHAGNVLKPFIDKRKDYSLHTAHLPDASVFFGAADLYAKTRDNSCCFTRMPNAAETHEKLVVSGLSFEVVMEDRVNRGDIGGGLLILDDVIALTDQTAKAIIRFVGEGGKVLLSGRSASLGCFTGLDKGFIRWDKPLLEDASIIEEILPRENRRITSSLPDWAELILRQREGVKYLHILNNNKGARLQDRLETDAYPIPGAMNPQIMSLPMIPKGRVSVRTDKKPNSVRFIPGNVDIAFVYKEGVVCFDTPEIEIHGIVGIWEA